MGYQITMGLDEVRFSEAKALEGLKALLGWEHDPLEKMRGEFYEELKTQIAAVEAGEADPVVILKQILEDEDFEVESVDGFLCLVDWGESGDGFSHNEGVTLAALGPLFEAGGSSSGHGAEGEAWCYSFLGGTYELGWVESHFYVSKEDRLRVQAAWKDSAGQIPGPLRDLLHDLLLRAEILLPAPPHVAVSA